MLWPIWASCTCWAPVVVVAPWNPKVDHNTNLGFLSTKSLIDSRNIEQTREVVMMFSHMVWGLQSYCVVSPLKTDRSPHVKGNNLSNTKGIELDRFSHSRHGWLQNVFEAHKVIYELHVFHVHLQFTGRLRAFLSLEQGFMLGSFVLRHVKCVYKTHVGAKVVPTNPCMHSLASYILSPLRNGLD